MQAQTHQPSRTNAVQLRKQLTDAERVLWQQLRDEQLGVKFRRQHPFQNYVLDFVSLPHKLVIEVDGGQHNESLRDSVRDEQLKASGFRVLRFWNHEVLKETQGVVQSIFNALVECGVVTHPHPNPPLEGEGIKNQPPLEGEGIKSRPSLNHGATHS